MSTTLNRTLQFLGALLPRVAYGVLVVCYTAWLVIRGGIAWLCGKVVRYG